jgi:hypothetical protein
MFQGAYYLYATVGLAALGFFYWVLPETKGQRLEDIEELFSRPWLSAQRPSAPAKYQSIRSSLRVHSSLLASPASSESSLGGS